MTDEDSKRIEELETKLLDLQIANLRKDIDDHEKRLRAVEETSTRFSFLLMLTVGGGVLSLLNLINTVIK